MMLYTEIDAAPHPRRVSLFISEKGIEVPTTRLELMKRQNKTPEYLAINSLGQVPALDVGDGRGIAESVSICRYLEEVFPAKPLFGRDAYERALIDQWIRRIEQRVWGPLLLVWTHADKRTAGYLPNRNEAFGESMRPIYADACRWLDGEIAGRDFIANDTYTMADIVTLTSIDFAKYMGSDMPDDAPHLHAWHTRVSARPSVLARRK